MNSLEEIWDLYSDLMYGVSSVLWYRFKFKTLNHTLLYLCEKDINQLNN